MKRCIPGQAREQKQQSRDVMLQEQQNRENIFLLVLFMALIASFIVWFKPYESKQSNLQLEHIVVAEGYELHQVENIQIFVKDEYGQPIQAAQVQLDAKSEQSSDTCKQWMNHVEAGLYEAECLLTASGKWQAELAVTSPQNRQTFQFEFVVKSPYPQEDPREKRK